MRKRKEEEDGKGRRTKETHMCFISIGQKSKLLSEFQNVRCAFWIEIKKSERVHRKVVKNAF
jgi:hypothetical protein